MLPIFILLPGSIQDIYFIPTICATVVCASHKKMRMLLSCNIAFKTHLATNVYKIEQEEKKPTTFISTVFHVV